MKNVTCALVLALAFTAASRISGTQQNSAQVVGSKASSFPIPTCPPDDPNGCGIDGPNGRLHIR